MTLIKKIFTQRKVRLSIIFCVTTFVVVLVASKIHSDHIKKFEMDKCEAMTPAERKEAFTRALMRIEVANAELSNRFAGRGIYRVGVARNFDMAKIKSMIDIAYSGKSTFDENFNISDVYDGNAVVQKAWGDGDALVSYLVRDGTRSDFIPFRDIVEVFGIDDEWPRSGRAIPKKERMASGDHVFRMREIFIMRDCCGKARRRSLSNEDHMKYRKGAYHQTMQFFSSGLNDRYLYVKTSACGEPATEDDKNGMGTRSLRTFSINKHTEVSE